VLGGEQNGSKILDFTLLVRREYEGKVGQTKLNFYEKSLFIIFNLHTFDLQVHETFTKLHQTHGNIIKTHLEAIPIIKTNIKQVLEELPFLKKNLKI
jgi:hypothetical protein